MGSRIMVSSVNLNLDECFVNGSIKTITSVEDRPLRGLVSIRLGSMSRQSGITSCFSRGWGLLGGDTQYS